MASPRIWLVGLLALGLGASRVALAAPVSNGCMQDVAGFGLNCTANDIQIAGLTNVVVQDDGCAFPGDTVTFDVTVELLLTAQARHDVGIYLSTDGGDALTGSCLIDVLPYQPDPPFLDLDGTNDDPNGVIQDLCGDIDANHNPIFHQIAGITVTCIDKDGDGKLDLPNCLSWRQPGANELCDQPTDAFPGAPSKCRCGSVDVIEIDVPPGEIQLTKTANPTSIAEPGAPVTFEVSVHNPSNSSVTLESLIDNLYGNLDGKGTCSVPQTIAAGGTYACSFTETVTGAGGGSSTDVVTASGKDRNGDPVSDSDDAVVLIVDVPSEIEVLKTATPDSLVEPGGLVTFTVEVKNVSLVDTVEIQSLIDSIYGNLDGQGTCSVPQTIPPGASYLCSFTANVTGSPGDSETDVVTATGVDDDDQPVRDADSATVSITDVPAQIRITKSASPDQVDEPGGTVTFDFLIENLSAVDAVTISSLNDTIYGDLDGKGTCAVPQVMPPLGSYSCSFDALVSGVGGDLETNVVTAAGQDDDGEPVSDDDSATVTVTNLPSSIAVTKSAVPGLLPFPGGAVLFTVLIENTSPADDVTITSLVDSVYGDLNGRGTCSLPQMIPVGGSYTCSFTENVTGPLGFAETDVIVASGTDEGGDPVSDDDAATVVIGQPIVVIGHHPAPSRIRFQVPPDRDSFYIKLGFTPAEGCNFDPTAVPFRFTLLDQDGVVFDGSLLAGDVQERGRRWLFLDHGALRGTPIRDGVRLVSMSRRSDCVWRLQMKAFRDDLTAADRPEMTVIVRAGDNAFSRSATWQQIADGWEVDFRNP